jgi:hypothetical protein
MILTISPTPKGLSCAAAATVRVMVAAVLTLVFKGTATMAAAPDSVAVLNNIVSVARVVCGGVYRVCPSGNEEPGHTHVLRDALNSGLHVLLDIHDVFLDVRYPVLHVVQGEDGRSHASEYGHCYQKLHKAESAFV